MPLFNFPFSVPAGGATSFSTPYDSVNMAGLPYPNIVVHIDLPAFTTAQLPDGQTFTLSLLESVNGDMSAPTGVTPMGVVTGAGGVGALAKIVCARLLYSGERFLR